MRMGVPSEKLRNSINCILNDIERIEDILVDGSLILDSDIDKMEYIREKATKLLLKIRAINY
jgi:hypothetical protein